MKLAKRLFHDPLLPMVLLVAAVLSTWAVLSWGSVAWAEPLHRSDVDADAKWLAHIDFDAGKATKVGLKVYKDWLSHGFAKESLQDIRETVGLDLLADVRGITFYSTRFEEYRGVVIVRAKVDRGRLLKILDGNATHETQQYGEHQLHTWVQEVEGHKSEVTGCFYRPTLVVLGRKSSEVKTALDVLDGKKPNLADSQSALNRKASKGTVFEAGAVGLADLTDEDIPFVSPIIRHCRSVLIDLGEDDGQVFIRVELNTKVEETARQILDVIGGFRAMTRLERAQDEYLLKSLDALKMKLDGAKLRIDWRMPGPAVMRLIEKEWKKQHLAD